jgi:hypothetical protein
VLPLRKTLAGLSYKSSTPPPDAFLVLEPSSYPILFCPSSGHLRRRLLPQFPSPQLSRPPHLCVPRFESDEPGSRSLLAFSHRVIDSLSRHSFILTKTPWFRNSSSMPQASFQRTPTTVVFVFSLCFHLLPCPVPLFSCPLLISCSCSLFVYAAQYYSWIHTRLFLSL